MVSEYELLPLKDIALSALVKFSIAGSAVMWDNSPTALLELWTRSFLTTKALLAQHWACLKLRDYRPGSL